MMHPGVTRAIRELGNEVDHARLTPLEKHEIGLILNQISLLIQVTNEYARRSLYNNLPPACQWRK